MSLFNRLNGIIKQKNLTFARIEKDLSFGNGSLKRWEFSSPSIDKVILLANYLNISLEWLATGKNNEATLSENETELLHIFSQFSDREQIKIIGQLENELKHNVSPSEYHQQVQTFDVKIAAKGGGISSQQIKMTPSELEKWIEEQKKFSE